MSLLVVEDDHALLRLLEALMKRGNIDIKTLSRGGVARDTIKSEKHAAVILDLMLPDLSGFEILRSLQAVRADLLSRIIVLTAASEATLVQLSPMRSSIWSLIRKPFDITELMDAVRSCIVRRGSCHQSGNCRQARGRRSRIFRRGASKRIPSAPPLAAASRSGSHPMQIPVFRCCRSGRRITRSRWRQFRFDGTIW